jgi:hypothetical protein
LFKYSDELSDKRQQGTSPSRPLGGVEQGRTPSSPAPSPYKGEGEYTRKKGELAGMPANSPFFRDFYWGFISWSFLERH